LYSRLGNDEILNDYKKKVNLTAEDIIKADYRDQLRESLLEE